MSRLKGIPAFRILLPALAGIVVVNYYPELLIEFILQFQVLSIVVFILSVSLQNKLNYGFRWIPGFLVTILFFLLFMVISLNHREIYKPGHFGKSDHLTNSGYFAEITDMITEKSKTVKSVIEIRGIISKGKVILKSGKCMVYLKKNDLAKKLKYGDLIFFNQPPQPIPEPPNPYQFNLRKYLANRNIYHQVYLTEDKWIFLRHSNSYSIKAMALNIREVMINKLWEHGLKDQEFSVASAILLGYDDKLDADLRSQYSGTGAMHVLSVSGLHLGIIYMIIAFLLGFLNKKQSTRLIKMFLVLIFIWAYAIVTGFGPSVLRSAIMFSIMNIGDTLRLSKNTYNTLSVAAFLILVFDPNALFDTGFQLSFGAVLSILLFQKPIGEIWKPKNVFIRYFWELTAVSLAAQIGTSPVAVYYFNQFPNYFLLTNWVVIPISFIILCLGFGFYLFFWIPFLSDWIAWLLSLSIRLMNSSVGLIEGLPGSKYTGIVISEPELILFYIIIICSLTFYVTKRTVWLNIILASITILISIAIFHQFKEQNLKRITIYSTQGATTMGFAHKHSGILISDSTFYANRQNFEFNVQRHFWVLGIKEISFYKTYSETISPENELAFAGSFGIFSGIRFFILDRKTEKVKPDGNYKSDLLVIAGNPKIDLKMWINNLNPVWVVFASSNSSKKIQQWKSECELLKQKSHSVNEQGAFIFSFR